MTRLALVIGILAIAGTGVLSVTGDKQPALKISADMEDENESSWQPMLLAGNTACNPRVEVCEA